MAWSAPDFGTPPTGVVITVAPANGEELIVKRVTVVRVPCTLRLPSPHGAPIEAWVLNRSKGLVMILPGSSDVIEANAVNEPLFLAPKEDAVLFMIDSGAGAPPRYWQACIHRHGSDLAAQQALEAHREMATHAAAIADAESARLAAETREAARAAIMQETLAKMAQVNG